MANHPVLVLDYSECINLVPFAEEAIESGLLGPEEVISAIADQARIVLSDGTSGKTLGELLAG